MSATLSALGTDEQPAGGGAAATPLDSAPFIQRHADGADDPASFAALRREGIRLVQGLSRVHWTDYNLHDPGVTMLEAVCFGLTELAYRADAPLVDQLLGRAPALAPERLGLPTPERALPCRASTAEDLRAWLLDRVPGLADASLHPLPGRGLLQMRLRLAPDFGHGRATWRAGEAPPAWRREAERGCVLAARRAYAEVRTLGEDLDDEIVVVEERPCTLHAHLEIGGSREPMAVLAEVYHACAMYIGAAVPLVSTAGLLAAGRPLESLYDGPAVQRCASDPRGARLQARRLYASEVADIVRGIDGVRQVRELTLDGRRSLVWFDERGALSLRVPGPGFDAAELRLTRRGTVLAIDPALLQREFEDLATQPPDAGTAGAQSVPPAVPAERRPRADEAPHVSVQQHLPPIYGLGDGGLPAEAGLSDRVRARQLSSYLSLFDQLMAHGQAQLAHLRELHELQAWRGRRPSYWWQVLGDASVPGLGSMLLDAQGQADPGRALTLPGELSTAFDDRVDRFQRALDATLALHGHVFPQNTLRQFLGHLDADEQERFLLRNKAAYLRWVLDHGADRAGGADLGRSGIGGSDNSSGLQRCARLLLGFDGPPAPSLLRVWLVRKVELFEGASDDPSSPLRRADRDEAAAFGAARAIGPPARPQRARRLQVARLPGEVLRAGADRHRYRWLPDEPGAGDRKSRGQLLLGPDEAGDWWQLGRCRWGTAAEVVDGLRRWMLHLQRRSEGLHVVEHVLLRARGDSAGHAARRVDAARLSLRVSVVLPNWTVRTRQQAFRQFADETMQLVSPAHVGVSCLWLDATAMADFEAVQRPWQDALRAHVASPAGDAAALDAAACAVIDQLRRHAPEGWL